MLKTSLIKFLFVAATQLKDFPSAKQELSGNLCMMEMMMMMMRREKRVNFDFDVFIFSCEGEAN